MLNRELFAEMLRVHAAKLNITRNEAAFQIGISKATMSRCCNGTFLPDVETFYKCCVWLAVEMSTFFNHIKK